MRKIIFLCIGLTLFGCRPFAKNKEYKVLDGFAQGTTYHIVYQDNMGRDLKPSIDSLLIAFDASLSIYQENSLVNRVNNNVSYELDSLFIKCFQISETVYKGSEGVFDVTGSPLFQLWGFGKGKRSEHISKHLIDSVMQYVGMPKVRIQDGRLIKSDPHVSLNFNAVAQGYSSDVVSSFLEKKGIKNYLVEIGGEIFCKGSNPKQKPWTVGIDKPTDNNNIPGESLQAYILLSGKGLATSGNYRKFFIENGQKFVHTINPLTGQTAKNSLLSATVVGPSAGIADAVATAYMVVGMEGVERLRKAFPECEVYLIYDQQGKYMEYMSEGMKKMLRHDH